MPKNLKAKGGISELVIRALKEIGNGEEVVTIKKEQIIELLKKRTRIIFGMISSWPQSGFVTLWNRRYINDPLVNSRRRKKESSI